MKYPEELVKPQKIKEVVSDPSMQQIVIIAVDDRQPRRQEGDRPSIERMSNKEIKQMIKSGGNSISQQGYQSPRGRGSQTITLEK